MRKKTFENAIIKLLNRKADFQDNMTFIKKYYSYTHYLKCSNILFKNKFYINELRGFWYDGG